MAKTYVFKKEHITVNGKATSISMEKLYWSALDQIAEVKRQPRIKVLTDIIARKPADYNFSSGWVRYYVMGMYFQLVKDSIARKSSTSKSK